MRRVQAKTALESGTVIVAEMQQAGRGRRGRVGRRAAAPRDLVGCREWLLAERGLHHRQEELVEDGAGAAGDLHEGADSGGRGEGVGGRGL